MSTTVSIENNAPRHLILPATDSFPQGVVLIPGLNKVPRLYLDEMMAYEVKDAKGKKRNPGAEELERLQQPVLIYSYEHNSVYKSQILIYKEDQDREEGPVPPATLDGYSQAGALLLVEATNSKATLELWKRTAKGALKDAILTKLGGMV